MSNESDLTLQQCRQGVTLRLTSHQDPSAEDEENGDREHAIEHAGKPGREDNLVMLGKLTFQEFRGKWLLV